MNERFERLKAVGGCAFPTAGYGDGMMLRDWFAGQAIVGLIAAEASASGTGTMRANGDLIFPATQYAKNAYALADAMLAIRAQGSR